MNQIIDVSMAKMAAFSSSMIDWKASIVSAPANLRSQIAMTPALADRIDARRTGMSGRTRNQTANNMSAIRKSAALAAI